MRRERRAKQLGLSADQKKTGDEETFKSIFLKLSPFVAPDKKKTFENPYSQLGNGSNDTEGFGIRAHAGMRTMLEGN